jgi:Ca-activated chloride channel family protein
MRRELGLILAGLILAGNLPAQAPQTETLRVEVSLVTVGVRVTDKKGFAIPNLRAEDFRLYEDAVEQKVAFFSAEEQPLSLGILLDRSDSMRLGNKFARAKAAAVQVVYAIRGDSEYLYIPFDANWPDAEFSEGRQQVRDEIAQTAIGSGTRLYDAVIAALETYKQAKYGRKALVVITDGADQHSLHTLDDLIRALQESHVQLYTIGYFNAYEREMFRRVGREIRLYNPFIRDNPMIVFNRLAKQSGAEAFFPESDKQLEATADRISEDLRTQYTLAYYPSNAVSYGQYRWIDVKLRKPGGLKVRARQGYIRPGTAPRSP